MKLAQRMSRLGTETAFEVLAKAQPLEAQGKHIIHLEIGEPDFETPPNIVEAGRLALSEGFTSYNPSPGYEDLKNSIEKLNLTVVPRKEYWTLKKFIPITMNRC